MKKILGLLSVFLLVAINAQTVGDYKYVMIPSEFATLKENYGMDTILRNSLKSKKYIVLSAEKSNWPNDALINPCKILNADVLNEKSLLRNKISLQFRDCNNKIIYSEKSSSTIKEFEPGFQDAMRQAAAKIPVSNPANTSVGTAPANEIIAMQTTNSGANSKAQDIKKSAQKYSKGNLTLQKIQIDESQFILVHGNSSVPFATFKTTAKNDVFRVKLASGESTLGYYENGNIVIEIPLNTGDFVKEVFIAN